MLVAKLPLELQLIVSRKLSEEDWNLDELLRVIEEEVVERERVSVTQTVKPRRDNKPRLQLQHLCQTPRGSSRVVATATRTISPLIAMWCLKSGLANKYFVRVTDASRAYVKVTLAVTVEQPIVVTSAMDAITPVFAHPDKFRQWKRQVRPHPW